MKVVFSVGAALRSEKTKTAKRINQCKSFIKLAIVAEGLEDCRTDESRHIVSFQCDELEVLDGRSSKNWETVFHLERDGRKVVVSIPSNYIFAPTIPGYY